MAEYLKLSEIIGDVATTQQKKYVSVFREAVKGGVLDAVPIEKSFSIGNSQFRDLIFEDSPALQKWRADTIKEFELSKQRGVQGISYESDIVEGEIDFKARAEEYRKSLKKRRKRSKPKIGAAVVNTDTSGQGAKKAPAVATESQASAVATEGREGGVDFTVQGTESRLISE